MVKKIVCAVVLTAFGCSSSESASYLPATALRVVFDGSGTWSQTVMPGVGQSVTFSASVDWHAAYSLSLPDFAPGGMQSAGYGTTVTGSSTITGMAGCSGPIVVNTRHGQGTPAPQAQTPFLLPIPSGSQKQTRLAIDAMGGYDYRLCDGEYNIGVGNWAPGSPDLPGYAGAPFFADFRFDRSAFAGVPPTMQQIPVSFTQHAPTGMADVSWSGTITLASEH